MTHILFVTPYYPPEKGAAPVRISETAVRLVKRGYDVTVLTNFPNYPSGIVPPEYRGHVLLRENLDGVSVVRVWSYVSPNKGFLRRILAHFSFGCLAPLLGGKEVGHPDVLEAAVIGIRHPKWDERPLLIVQLKPDSKAKGPDILHFMEGKYQLDFCCTTPEAQRHVEDALGYLLHQIGGFGRSPQPMAAK